MGKEVGMILTTDQSTRIEMVAREAWRKAAEAAIERTG